MPKDVESNTPSDAPSDTSRCETYTIHLIPQQDLEIVGIGACGEVYHVNDQVVLKSCRIFQPYGSDASRREHLLYASDTLFHYNLLRNERTVLQLLQNRPHPHLIEAIDTDQVEGIYLRKYRRQAIDAISTQSRRIKLYRDITDALHHLHSLGIIHADIRIDNILFDERGSAVLCDFSAASPKGEPNLVFPEFPLPINGPSPTLCEASDMFAMASLMYRMEHGTAPELIYENGTLALPEIKSGHQAVDDIIRNAWLGRYQHTSEMLKDLASIDVATTDAFESARPQPRAESMEILKNQIKKWKAEREEKFGEHPTRILPSGLIFSSFVFANETRSRLCPRRSTVKGSIESPGGSLRYGCGWRFPIQTGPHLVVGKRTCGL